MFFFSSFWGCFYDLSAELQLQQQHLLWGSSSSCCMSSGSGTRGRCGMRSSWWTYMWVGNEKAVQ